jgi:dihydrodipicolinate synthase/N-acetylneuraminate lyase
MLRLSIRESLQRGLVIPACPLALNAARKLDERRQRALLRYYDAAGAGGVAVGVHTTQFAIREPRHGLFKPVLELAVDELVQAEQEHHLAPLVRIGGVCGATPQAMREAGLLRDLGYDIALLSLAALRDLSEDQLLSHCREVAGVLPIMGFYLQPAVGGRMLPFSFWRRFAELENVVAVKLAPFNRYHTFDVVRAVAEAGRVDIALYTGNDDNIVIDLLTPFRFQVGGSGVELRIVGGLLGHWAVWTRAAVELLRQCHRVVDAAAPIPDTLLQRAVEITDCNSAFFDAAHQYAGCIPGLHEVLRRQGLLESTRCLDPNENLSPGQNEEIDRVYAAYPHLNDDQFVAAHREEWIAG